MKRFYFIHRISVIVSLVSFFTLSGEARGNPIYESTRNEISGNNIIGISNKDTVSYSEDLPLEITEAKVTKREKPLVFFISGDGGWNSFETDLATLLAADGISTIGLDAQKYFWYERTPGEAASDISKVMDFYLKKWHKNKIILMGFSMGAEVIPFMFEMFPAEIRRKTKTVVLLSPEENTDFEVHITNMLGFGSPYNTYDVVAELKKVSAKVPVYIISGEDENSTLPALLIKSSVSFDTVPGGHHYDNAPQAIFDILHKKKIVD